MFGSLLSIATKIITAPIDIVDIGVDVVTGGDGSKRSRQNSPLSGIIDTRDDVADAFDELDD